MLAIIQTGGKQYKVTEGSEIWVEKLEGQPGDEIVFDKVLMISGDGEVHTGGELKASVRGEVLRQDRRKKIIVFKQIRRKRYRRTKGHRQYFTSVRITGITLN
jgi:large subunit ribosomal protein L21